MKLALLSLGLGLLAPFAFGQDPLRDTFLSPPESARPRTFWFWMNGNVTADGITRDLEALQRIGVGGVMAYDGSDYLPAGPAGYLDSHWRSLMLHAIKEAHRLGLDFGLHNGPGWSSSGGPWITPPQSMQQVVWTETTVRGGQRLDLTLDQPQTNREWYADSFVIAFPSLPGEEVPYEQDVVAMTRPNGTRISVKEMSDGSLRFPVPIAKDEVIRFTLRKPTTFHALSAWSGEKSSLGSLELKALDANGQMKLVTTITGGGRHGILAPAVRSFAPVTTTYLELRAARSGSLAEFVLHRSPRTPDWAVKANFDYRFSAHLAMPEQPVQGIDPAQVINLTDKFKQGRLVWDAPSGAWTVLRVGHTTTGKENVAASAAGRGLECDKFTAAAVEHHFNQVVGRIRQDAEWAGVKGPQTLEVDSYEAGMQNWSATFPDEFERRVGYPLWRYLPAVFGRVVVDSAVTERFLFDYRRVQADLMTENYYGHLGKLARAAGMRYYVEGYGPGNFDELRVSGLPDVPMTEFWTRTPWTPNRSVKMVTSAAHVYGKPLVAAEAFTGELRTSRYLEYPYALKVLGDEMMAQGVNQFYFHRFAHQPHPTAAPGMAMGPYGMHFDRTNTWFPRSAGWISYLSRTQHLLRQGRPVADILVYTGERCPDPSQMSQPVVPRGYNYDLVNTDVVLNRIQVKEGLFTLPEGGSYRVLVLPAELQAVRPAFVDKLAEFARAGGLILGPKPRSSSTLEGYPQSEQRMLAQVEELWGSGRIRSDLTLAQALQQTTLQPDFLYTSASPDHTVSWQHRALPDGDLYFIANRQRLPMELVASFRGTAGRQPEIWRTEGGETGDAVVFREESGRTRLPLRLEPAESLFVLFRKPVGPAFRNLRRDGVPVVSNEAPTPSKDIPHTNFTMAVWVKPDTHLRILPTQSTTGRTNETSLYYAIPADPGEARFGPDTAVAGLGVGRNGLFVIERSWQSSPAVLVAEVPISGWTHVAVVYRNGKPHLYVNGAAVASGLVSGKKVYSGVGAPPPPSDYTLPFPSIESMMRSAGQNPPPSRGQVFQFEGNLTPAVHFPRALDALEIKNLAEAGIPAMDTPSVTSLLRQPGGAITARLWQSGHYQLGEGTPLDVAVNAPRLLTGPWQVHFEPNRGAPASVSLETLRSLHLHPDPGVRHFSGTATYQTSFEVPADWLTAGRSVILDLGRVEVIGEVRVNGQTAATLWKEPFRVDLTSLVRAGPNTLEVDVTNLWTNRLIGDESLPAENDFGLRDEQGNDPHGITRLPDWYRNGEPKPPGGRTTFTTWRFYESGEPLVASGLLGPVHLLNPVTVTLKP